ncbi:MAG: PIN domain-containing protein, partial [Treponema sp.]|nr:PIN domain-containing protein [Treponema sp.]
IVDSTVWIDGFNPKIKTPEKELLKQLIQNDFPIYLCPVIYQEVLQGIREDKKFDQIKFIFQNYRMINMDLIYVTNYAINLYRHLRKKGITIRKSIDCLIASYAILGDMYLLHNDSDFTQIAKESKLKIITI